MRRTIILIIIFLVGLGSSFLLGEGEEDNPIRLFIKAKTSYSLSNYDEAIKAYEQILSKCLESGNLYYNLGNAYFKKGQLGRAILNYKRARFLIPRDSDLMANYHFALSLVKQNFSQVNKGLVNKIIDGYGQKLTLDEMCIIILLLYVGLIIIIILSFYFTKLKKYIIFITPVFVLLILLNIMTLLSAVKQIERAAVIIEKEVDSKFEPFDSATTYFRLFEGAEVFVLEEKSEWCKIERADGKIGWISRSALEKIYP